MIKTNSFRLLTVTKDGGEESRVWAYWLFAWKALFSVGLLRFEDGTRDAYHSHAFDCVSWVLKGQLLEEHRDRTVIWEGRTCNLIDVHQPSLAPVVTRRSTYHRVRSIGRTWVLTFRGPWSNTWREALPTGTGDYAERTLTHGRQEVAP